MIHSYDVDIAREYGFGCAVLLYHFYYWVENNKANGRNQHEDKYWTYQTIKGLATYFPEMSERTIKRSIKKLEDEGLIEIGNFNKSPYDRTNWYTVTEMGKSMMPSCHLRECQIGTIKSDKVEQPIPDIYTDKKTDSTLERSVADRVVCEWNLLSDVGISAVAKLLPTTKRYTMLKKRIEEYGLDAVIDAIGNIRKSSFLQGKSGNRGWKITFDWFVRPNNFPKVYEGAYSDADADAEEKEEYRDPRFEPEIAIDDSWREGY